MSYQRFEINHKHIYRRANRHERFYNIKRGYIKRVIWEKWMPEEKCYGTYAYYSFLNRHGSLFRLGNLMSLQRCASYEWSYSKRTREKYLTNKPRKFESTDLCLWILHKKSEELLRS